MKYVVVDVDYSQEELDKVLEEMCPKEDVKIVTREEFNKLLLDQGITPVLTPPFPVMPVGPEMFDRKYKPHKKDSDDDLARKGLYRFDINGSTIIARSLLEAQKRYKHRHK